MAECPHIHLRAGVSLQEVLVVLAIVGLISAIGIPAVLAARERARATMCRSQMKQLALGCELYHGIHGRLPPGQMFGPYGIGPDSTSWSWLARILPHIDQDVLYRQGAIPLSSLRDSGIAAQQIPLLLCPSDSERSSGPRRDAGNMRAHAFAVGHTNYKGVSGANWGADASQGLSPAETGAVWINVGTNGSYDGLSNGDGLMFRTDYRVRRRHADVIDGLSQTLMVGEALPAVDGYCSWPYANHAYSTCAIPPNCHPPSNPYDWALGLSFRSAHPNGLFFAFADGRVQFVHDGIELSIYRGMATISGGECYLESATDPSTSGTHMSAATLPNVRQMSPQTQQMAAVKFRERR